MEKHDYEKLEELHRLLPEGKENALPRKELAVLFGTNDRKARDILHEIRIVLPVCSNTQAGGYYRPKDKEEASMFVRQMTSYIKNIRMTIEPAERFCEADGQRSLHI